MYTKKERQSRETEPAALPGAHHFLKRACSAHEKALPAGRSSVQPGGSVGAGAGLARGAGEAEGEGLGEGDARGAGEGEGDAAGEGGGGGGGCGQV